jgi:hypothetical protein
VRGLSVAQRIDCAASADASACPASRSRPRTLRYCTAARATAFPDDRGATARSTVPDLSSAAHPPPLVGAGVANSYRRIFPVHQPKFLTALTGVCLLPIQPALAHGFAGPHMFISTLLIDDPNVADEASLPTFMFLPQPNDGGVTPGLYNLSFEFDKRITENFGFSLSDGYQWLRTPGASMASGWQNLEGALKYKVYVNPEHEFMLSLGVSREFARTGATGSTGAALDNDDTGSTTPTIFWGKGFGDLPIGILRPLALTGTFGYQIADKKLKVIGTDPDSGDPLFNNGTSNQWTGGLSLQYSIRYLQSQVKDLGLPEFVNKLTPVAEVAWSSPASKPNQSSTQYLFGLGVNYTAETYALTVEALIPGNRQTGSHLGVIAQFHLYFDDLFPNSLGKPIVNWWQ